MKLDSQLERLIFDRVPNDITARNKKGYYNYNDLNRIEIWCRYLEHWINENHYYLKIDTKINWCRNDFPTVSQLERIRNNIQVLKDAYYILNTTPATPVTLNQMTIYKANDIERILYDIDKILIHMCNNFIYCGISELAQSRLWNKRFRKSKTWTSQPYKLSQYKNTDTLKMIATQNDKTLPSNTKVLKLAQIDKTDDICASVNEINKSMQIIDDLVGYECNYYTLKNLINDSSFEKDKWSGGNYSSKEKLFNTRSLYFPAGATTVATINTERPIVNHQYYGRRYMKTNGKNEPADRRFELWGGDGTNLNWVFAYNEGNYPEWNFDSAIHTIIGVDYPQEKQTIIRCFNVNTSADTWIDGVLLVDLTDSFGVGKEPSKEWCDANIPYFDGTYTIKIRKEKD